MFVLSTVMPQATLLYWLGNSVFFSGVQEVLKKPRWARRMGIPTAMLPPPRTSQEEKGMDWGNGHQQQRSPCCVYQRHTAAAL